MCKMQNRHQIKKLNKNQFDIGNNENQEKKTSIDFVGTDLQEKVCFYSVNRFC